MRTVGRLMLVAFTVMTLSACSGQNAPSVSTTTPNETSSPRAVSSAPLNGDAILIETRISDARMHTGEVVGGSVLGESAFCEGGETTGSSAGPTITTTFTCADGTLTVQYAPTQRSLVQSSEWEVVSGTGSFEGLGGAGHMVAAFGSDNPDAGREIFTGTVSQ
jgi:hypothetical protein